MRAHCFFWGVLFVMNPIYAAIYQWTDSHNNVHFSDSPQLGAEEIKLAQRQRYSSPHQPVIPNTEPIPLVMADKTTTTTIIQPEDKATIRNASGVVSLIMAVNPKLKPGEKLQVVLNGSPVGEPKASTAITLTSIHRGQHVLLVQRVDGTGGVRSTSNRVTIYMMPPKINPLNF